MNSIGRIKINLDTQRVYSGQFASAILSRRALEEDDEEFRGLSRPRIDVIVGVKQASPQKGEPRGKTQHRRSLLSRAAIGRLKRQANAV